MDMATELTRLWRGASPSSACDRSCRHVPHQAPAHLATRPHWQPAAETVCAGRPSEQSAGVVRRVSTLRNDLRGLRGGSVDRGCREEPHVDREGG